MLSNKIAIFGSQNNYKRYIINQIKVFIPEIENISIESLKNNHTLFICNYKKYITEGYDLIDLIAAKKHGFITVFVQCAENTPKNYFDYILSISPTDTEEKLNDKIKKILTESKFWIFIKKDYKKSDGKIVEREFSPTFHAIQQFKKRFETLDNLICNSQMDDNFIIKRISSYKKYLDVNNDFVDCFKKVFLSSKKLENISRKYRIRRQKHNKNTEFFTDNLFVFIVLHNIILTSELMPTSELKYINKITSSKNNVSLLFK